jgi:hypothetical protein
LPYYNPKTKNADIQNEINFCSKALEWILEWSFGKDFDENTEKGSSMTKFHTIKVFLLQEIVVVLLLCIIFADG